MKFSPHKSSAFTLIELLVSITIILLLVGGALAGYTRYTDKQRLVAAAEKIQSGFREAQNMVEIGNLGNCNELAYVQFFAEVESGQLRYQIRTFCTDPSDNSSLPYVNIDSDFSLTSNINISFYPYGNLSGSVNSTLSSDRSNYSAGIVIDQGGGMTVTYSN
jgi:prepilin-type N-terminal cleavage/methylation domain-containing protein